MSDPDKPVRSWLDAHPATTLYIAIVVTVLLFLQVGQTIGLFR